MRCAKSRLPMHFATRQSAARRRPCRLAQVRGVASAGPCRQSGEACIAISTAPLHSRAHALHRLAGKDVLLLVPPSFNVGDRLPDRLPLLLLAAVWAILGCVTVFVAWMVLVCCCRCGRLQRSSDSAPAPAMAEAVASAAEQPGAIVSQAHVHKLPVLSQFLWLLHGTAASAHNSLLLPLASLVKGRPAWVLGQATQATGPADHLAVPPGVARCVQAARMAAALPWLAP